MRYQAQRERSYLIAPASVGCRENAMCFIVPLDPKPFTSRLPTTTTSFTPNAHALRTMLPTLCFFATL